jgi:ribosomal protein S27AE
MSEVSDINVKCAKCGEHTGLRESDDGWRCAKCGVIVIEKEDSRPCDTEAESRYTHILRHRSARDLDRSLPPIEPGRQLIVSPQHCSVTIA